MSINDRAAFRQINLIVIVRLKLDHQTVAGEEEKKIITALHLFSKSCKRKKVHICLVAEPKPYI